MFEVLNTPLQSTLPISNAVRVKDMIYTSQIPRIPATGEVMTSGDVVAQAHQTFENLRTVLQSVGGSLANVVQMTVFLTDAADGLGMNSVYKEYFSAPYPSRATVVVKALMVPGMLIEITSQALVGA